METWLPYTRGAILASTEDDVRKLQHAWWLVQRRIAEGGRESVFNFRDSSGGSRRPRRIFRSPTTNWLPRSSEIGSGPWPWSISAGPPSCTTWPF